MNWTLELISYLDNANWPASKNDLIDYATQSGYPTQVIENLQQLDDNGGLYEGVENIWPDYPKRGDSYHPEDEY